MQNMIPTSLSPVQLNSLQEICTPERVFSRYFERVAYASDASFYRLIPLAVVQPESLQEMQQLFIWSKAWSVPLTFRAAGTSLSGQAITSGLLVDISTHWRDCQVIEQGLALKTQPGVIGGYANAVLKPYGRKIGPDPASIGSCMLGGILANNASGMCCGVKDNAYHTLRSLAFVLPNGNTVNSADPDAPQKFIEQNLALANSLTRLRQSILQNPDLSAKIRNKYRYKNTTGYSLNAFLDFEEPLDIFTHLLIGSEGTLAFISEAILETIPAPKHRLTSLLLFASMDQACQAVQAITELGAATVELMDYASLCSLPVMLMEQILPDFVAAPVAGQTALLVEFHLEQEAQVHTSQMAFQDLLKTLDLVSFSISTSPSQQALIWKIRKGLYPSIGALRKSGSTVIIEDILFPPEQLASGVAALQALFQKHHYEQAIIFGHAKDGNLHFVITQAFDSPSEIERYDALMQDLARMVLSFGGALKAEHGTGRNMAPFVLAEWGPEALQIMQQLKAACDPHQLLNPGVILNPDEQAHLKDLKSMPEVDPIIEQCTECGFCEPACPSRRLTLSPRQRIVVLREQARLKNGGDQDLLKDLETAFHYSGIETCAADSLCSLACPIGIDTGQMIKKLRTENISPLVQNQVSALARRFQHLETGFKITLGSAHVLDRILGEKTLNWVAQGLNKLSGLPIPQWSRTLPPPNLERLPNTRSEAADFIYFPSCLTRSLGYQKRPDLPHTLVRLAQRGGQALHIPENTQGLCCGLPFASKGFHQAGEHMRKRTLAHLWSHSHHGQLPVISDTSPCTLHLQEGCHSAGFEDLKIIDSVAYLEQHLADHLPLEKRHQEVVIHPVCSLKKMGLEADLCQLAARCAQKVTLPLSAGCCGFAGDRGLLFPELPQHALADTRQELETVQADFYCASSRSCEMGLSQHLQRPYESIVYLLANSLRLSS